MKVSKLKNWCWHYKLKWENFSADTVFSFAKFIDDGVVGSRIKFTDPIRLRGVVYNRPGIKDGTDVVTSNVVSLECLPPLIDASLENIECGSHGGRFIAVTKSGTRYEFVEYGLDGMSGDQILAMGTIFNYEGM